MMIFSVIDFNGKQKRWGTQNGLNYENVRNNILNIFHVVLLQSLQTAQNLEQSILSLMEY